MSHQAIYNTHPEVVSIRGDDAFDAEGNSVALDQALVDAEVARLQAEKVANAYRAERAKAYPAIGDQLDALFKHLNYRRTQGDALVQDLDDAIGEWLSVKAQHPKPE